MHRQMSRQTRLAADNDKVLYRRAPRSAYLGTDNAVPPDLKVAGDLNQIIDLRTIAHRRFAGTRPVEGRIGADLDIIANHHRADLRNLRMPTIAPLPKKDLGDSVWRYTRSPIRTPSSITHPGPIAALSGITTFSPIAGRPVHACFRAEPQQVLNSSTYFGESHRRARNLKIALTSLRITDVIRRYHNHGCLTLCHVRSRPRVA